MALLAQPALLLLDEPTTSLDVTVEAGMVELIASLRTRYRTALLFISHNLGLVAQVCDRVAVMYSGEIVEEGAVAEVFAEPRHPYTRGLIRCIPLPYVDQRAQRLVPIPGQVSLPNERPSGCYFGPRCQHFRKNECGREHIELVQLDAQTNRLVRCVRWKAAAMDAAPMQTREKRTGDNAIAVSVRDLSKDYAIDERSLWGVLTWHDQAPRHRQSTSELRHQAGPDACHRRGIRLRKVDLRQSAHRSRECDRRRNPDG